MDIIEAIILGLVQGLTEFLPISSSAHLTLLPQMVGWNTPLLNSLAFDVALHFGTLIAVLIYFRNDIFKMVSTFTCSLWDYNAGREPDAKLAWYIILGTLPAVIMAVFFKHAIEGVLRTPLVVAGWLIIFGLIMAMAEAFTRKVRTVRDMKVRDAVFIGLAQALALMPGVSRSGSTITAGLLLGFKRGEAARFAFLLSIPAILGATVFHLQELLEVALDQLALTLLVGTIAAAISGYACIKFLLAYLQKGALYIFVFYRLALGVFVIGWVLMGR